jgi:DNA-binding protein Fis
VELFPPHVRGGAPVRIARPGSRSPETLCQELVSLGMLSAGESAENLYERIVSLVERELIHQVLKSCGGVQTKAAVRLGINRNTLHKKIEEYGLESQEN